MTLLNKNDKFVFLVGAGCSMDPPSRLPSALEFVREIVTFCAPPEEFETIMNLNSLKYEAIVEIVEKRIDRDLIFLDYLETKKQPNIIHFFLANNILNNNNVITTNFDYLIEIALIELLPKGEEHVISPIITQEQYLNFQKDEKINNVKDAHLFKIHGSKKNIITGQDTSSSLVTTLSALGKNKEEGKTFSIEAYKKAALEKIINQRNLIVLGYSGNDDFDIAPFIKEVKTYNKIIWIDHDRYRNDKDKIEIEPISSTVNNSPNEKISKQEQFLREICSLHGIEIINVKANTTWYVSEVLWPSLLESTPKLVIENEDNADDQDNANISSFRAYMESISSFNEIDQLTKHHFAIDVYDSVGDWKNALHVSKKGLELARAENNEKQIAEFMIRFGYELINDSKLEEAMKMFLDAKIKFERLNDSEGVVTSLCSLGNIAFSLSNYEEANRIFDQAYNMRESINNLEDLTNLLINLGKTQLFLGKSELALSKYREALDLVNRTGNLNTKASILKNIGIIYEEIKDYKDSMQYLKESFQILKILGDSRGLVELYHIIGTLCLNMEDFDGTLNNYLDGIALAIKIGHVDMQAQLAIELAKYYDSIDDEDTATQYFQAAMDRFDQVGNIEIKLSIIGEVALSCYNKEAYDVALDYFNMCLTMAREVDDLIKIVTYLHWIAMTHSNLTENEKAYNIYSEIVRLLENTKDLTQKAYFLRQKGIACYNASKNINESINLLEQSLSLYQQLNLKDAVEELREDLKNIKSDLN
ncbi:MAG: tetratricopeptide repeat protein [Candidatus Lokiarchaeota archaeon]|nr:tetratricopeptide repeat protein [Candidatus Lokiarchaeota archaeon]